MRTTMTRAIQAVAAKPTEAQVVTNDKTGEVLAYVVSPALMSKMVDGCIASGAATLKDVPPHTAYIREWDTGTECYAYLDPTTRLPHHWARS